MAAWLWIVSHKKLCAFFLALLLAAGWGGYVAYRWGEAAVNKAEQAVKDANAARDAALEANRQAEASAKAAQTARTTNDREIPRIRAEAGARADRAATADERQRVLDSLQALGDYLAADCRLRGKCPG